MVDDSAAPKANAATTIGVSGLATGGGDLSTNRTITVPKSSSAQALAGTDDTTAMTPARVAQAMTTRGTLYGSDFGMNGGAGSTFDNTPAFNALIAAAKAGNQRMFIDKGVYYFKSKPSNIDFPADLSGLNKNATVMIRDYNEASSSTGFLHLIPNCNGSTIRNMAIEANVGTTGGCLIAAVSSTTVAIGGLSFENLVLSSLGSATHFCSLYLNGSAKMPNVPPGTPQGIRSTNIYNVDIFGSTSYSLQAISAEGLTWNGGGMYPAGALQATYPQSGGLLISGITGNLSQYININVSTTGGLNLTNCKDLNLTIPNVGDVSGVSIGTDTTCSTCLVSGKLYGTFAGSWTDSGIIRPGTGFATS